MRAAELFRVRPGSRSLGVLACLAALAGAGEPAWADWPDPAGGVEAVVRGGLRVAGDTIGGLGMITAGGVALAGDGVSLVDNNLWTRPLLRGTASSLIRRTALALSWTTSGALEGLRAEDIERLPEAPATYLEAAPALGRLDTVLDGLGALRLALGDALAMPPLALLRAAGAETKARRLERHRQEARIRLLGPEPLPP